MLDYPIYDLSDLHIPVHGRPDELHDLLARIRGEAGGLVLNGDIVDLLAASSGRIVADPVYQDLEATTRQVPTVYCKGNHDWAVPDYMLPAAEKVERFELDGWHFQHGHQWDRAISWLGFLARFFPIIPIVFPLPPLYLSAEDLKNLTGPTDIYGFWHSIIEIGARGYADKNRVNVCFGHTHLPLSVTSPTLLTICNTGDWVDSYSWAVLDQDGEMRLHSLWEV